MEAPFKDIPSGATETRLNQTNFPEKQQQLQKPDLFLKEPNKTEVLGACKDRKGMRNSDPKEKDVYRQGVLTTWRARFCSEAFSNYRATLVRT